MCLAVLTVVVYNKLCLRVRASESLLLIVYKVAVVVAVSLWRQHFVKNFKN